MFADWGASFRVTGPVGIVLISSGVSGNDETSKVMGSALFQKPTVATFSDHISERTAEKPKAQVPMNAHVKRLKSCHIIQ
jgi:hypothetical protein